MFDFLGLFLMVLLAFTMFMTGRAQEMDSLQQSCIEKYSYMPHDQVGKHCEDILKFKKEDPKKE